MSNGVPGTYTNGRLPDPRQFQAGTVGVVASESARYTSFTHALMGVTAVLPPGSGVIMQCSMDVCKNRNLIVRQMRGEWVWFIDDDHVFGQDILLQLLAHNVDIIVPHCLKRVPGWEPVVYSHETDDGWHHIAELPAKGLTKVHAAGTAGMLIRRAVLDALEDPWFTPSRAGANVGEDLEFCRKAREAGFDIYCDPEVMLGHTSIHTVWPRWQNGRWHLEHVHNREVTIPVTRVYDEYDPVALEPETEQVPA